MGSPTGCGVHRVVRVAMPNFYPGSAHKVTLRVKNTGAAPTAVGGTGSITITPDGGTIDLSSLLLMPIAPGATVEAVRDFTIWPLAVPGSQNVWALSMNYDSQTLLAQGDAFKVEVPTLAYPQDDWEEWASAPGQQFRYENIAAGYEPESGVGRAFIKFPPVGTSRVLLRLYLVGQWYGNPEIVPFNNITVGGRTVLVDSTYAVPPVGLWVKIYDWPPLGSVVVVIEPSAPPGSPYYRAYGSIRGDPRYKASLDTAF